MSLSVEFTVEPLALVVDRAAETVRVAWLGESLLYVLRVAQ